MAALWMTNRAEHNQAEAAGVQARTKHMDVEHEAARAAIARNTVPGLIMRIGDDALLDKDLLPQEEPP